MPIADLGIADCREESMNPKDFKARTRAFALRIIRVTDLLKEAVEILSITVSSIKTARGLRKG